MKLINRTIGALGLLASVMALSSLIYGAFQEPLGPYMQGVMGGVIDVYRAMRDALFAGLGWTFSGFINWIGQWLTWLPPAPWFSIPSIGLDGITLWFLCAGTTYRAEMMLAKMNSTFKYLGGKATITFYDNEKKRNPLLLFLSQIFYGHCSFGIFSRAGGTKRSIGNL